MLISEIDPGDADDVALALTLIRTFGDRARGLVIGQIAALADQPDVAFRWQAALHAMTALTQANLHMEAALDLLDAVNATSVAPKLDHAIDSLGLRIWSHDNTPVGDIALRRNALFYRQRTKAHVDLARCSDDRSTKAMHLNIAARFASLGEEEDRSAGP